MESRFTRLFTVDGFIPIVEPGAGGNITYIQHPTDPSFPTLVLVPTQAGKTGLTTATAIELTHGVAPGVGSVNITFDDTAFTGGVNWYWGSNLLETGNVFTASITNFPFNNPVSDLEIMLEATDGATIPKTSSIVFHFNVLP
jgi:hypothetical protein